MHQATFPRVLIAMCLQKLPATPSLTTQMFCNSKIGKLCNIYGKYYISKKLDELQLHATP